MPEWPRPRPWWATQWKSLLWDQLEQILPRGIAVGSGCVIDTYGGTSRQQDVVLYERDICPVFSINDTPETTYYPCEGVIAVGEVKSALDSQTLADAFLKVESVKRLQRRDILHSVPSPDTGRRFPIQRKYGSLHPDSILDMSERDAHDHRNQIFGFVLAGKLNVKVETLCASYLQLARQTGDVFSPNLVTSLTGERLVWATNKSPRQIYQQRDGKHTLTEVRDAWGSAPAAQNATHVAIYCGEAAFRALIDWIYNAYTIGITSAAQAFEHYIRGNNNSTLLVYVGK